MLLNQKNEKKRQISAIIGVGIAMILLTAFRLIEFNGIENSVDCLYHARIALEGWDVFAAKTFPTLTMSSWTAHFADKELLYHFILGSVQTFVILAGLPEYPFHVSSLFFCLLVLSCFALIAKELKIKYLYFFIPLLILILPPFTSRILMLRPHTFSIALIIFSCFIFMKTKSKKDIWKPLLIGFLFSWSYSNPHFVLFIAGAYAFAHFFFNKERSFIIFGGTFLGLLLGFVIHPQFPNTFINWKIQCIDVVSLMMLGKENSVIGLGTELYLKGYLIWKELIGFLILAAANLILALWSWKKYGRRFFIPETIALLLLSLITALGTLQAYRVLEYALPLNMLSFLYFFTRNKMIFPPYPSRKSKWVYSIFMIIIIVPLLFYSAKVTSGMTFRGKRLDGIKNFFRTIHFRREL